MKRKKKPKLYYQLKKSKKNKQFFKIKIRLINHHDRSLYDWMRFWMGEQKNAERV